MKSNSRDAGLTCRTLCRYRDDQSSVHHAIWHKAVSQAAPALNLSYRPCIKYALYMQDVTAWNNQACFFIYHTAL